MTTQIRSAKPKQKKQVVPEYLIRDVIDGEVFYYAGYQDVLNNKKTAEEVRACSGLQSWIISDLLRIFFLEIKDKKYYALTNNVGIHLAEKDNLESGFGFF